MQNQQYLFLTGLQHLKKIRSIAILLLYLSNNLPMYCFDMQFVRIVAFYQRNLVCSFYRISTTVPFRKTVLPAKSVPCTMYT